MSLNKIMFAIKKDVKRRNKYLTLSVAIGVLSLSVFATVTLISSTSQSANAQQAAGTAAASSPLKFFIKYSKSGATNNSSAAGAQPATSGGGATTKQITISVNLQKGTSGTPVKLPITATVPANATPQDLQLCALVAGGTQTCQVLGGKSPASIDLTKSSNSTSAANNPNPPAARTAPPR
jgi:hypothetical protein